MDYDFCGWATRNNIECSDGRTILKDAFKDNHGQKVPLVWNHDHNSPDNVLGHALLENREEGVYAYCKFNNTESGKQGKALVVNGDVSQLSIYANKLKSQMNKVVHGCIREVSLVLAGANPGAYIESVVMHGEGADAEEEVVIYTDEDISVDIEHSDNESEEDQGDEKGGENVEDNKEMVEVNEGETMEKDYAAIFDTLSDEQKEAVYAIVGASLEEAGVEVEDEEEIEESETEEVEEEEARYEAEKQAQKEAAEAEKQKKMEEAADKSKARRKKSKKKDDTFDS